MTVEELIQKNLYEVISNGNHTDSIIEDIFCCDLLSIAMSKAPAGCVWVTVMANVNTLAVASLTEAACIILAEDVRMDKETIQKAKSQGITVLSTKQSVYHTAKQVDCIIHAGN